MITKLRGRRESKLIIRSGPKPWKRKRRQRARLKVYLKTRERRRISAMLRQVGIDVNEDFIDNALDDWS